ncbi:hypothetical protein AB0873_10480 [Micromonospora sp. NPDC047707]|uniref:hypothetical protein n=1 Tax=unclassified Micromonospora TaxID=2617518 RepID=UPI0012B4D98F|nr:hypothetical protein [Micromonospora sp. WMMC415]QGN46214.1 hypothetical protein GKC29_04715 [Micromonospora sp. WMMC415]
MSLVVGSTIRVPEDSYRFGTGPLVLHISEVLGRTVIEGHEWAELRGREVREDGSVAVRERYASVRVDRVRVVPR